MRNQLWIVGCFLLLGLTGATSAHAAQKVIYTAIVGNNQPLDSTLEVLSYADDDAASMYELLQPYSDRIALLTVLDADTQRLHPGLAAHTQTPSRTALRNLLQSWWPRMKKDKAAGKQPELIFYFSGHGSVTPQGVGYLHFLDGKFTRSQLFQEVVSPSPATFNHIIIDACSSGFMVKTRGAGDEAIRQSFKRAADALLADESLARHPNTGIILSTSAQASVHEWNQYRGGIFSYELRSALRGPADVNGDLMISYPEIDAFLDASNALIPDPELRIHTTIRAPAENLKTPLLRLKRVRKNSQISIKFDKETDGHYWIETAGGVRYADFNKESDYPAVLYLPAGQKYLIHRLNEWAPIRNVPVTRLASLRWRTEGAKEARIRGAISNTYKQFLFGQRYGVAFFRGWKSARMDQRETVALATRGKPRTVRKQRRSRSARNRRQRLGILPLKHDKSVPEWLVRPVVDRLSVELYRTGRFEVFNRTNLRDLYEQQVLNDYDCSTGGSNDCVASIGANLGVDKIVHGTIRLLGDPDSKATYKDRSYYVSLTILDVGTGKVERAADMVATGVGEELLAGVSALARKLAGVNALVSADGRAMVDARANTRLNVDAMAYRAGVGNVHWPAWVSGLLTAAMVAGSTVAYFQTRDDVIRYNAGLLDLDTANNLRQDITKGSLLWQGLAGAGAVGLGMTLYFSF